MSIIQVPHGLSKDPLVEAIPLAGEETSPKSIYMAQRYLNWANLESFWFFHTEEELKRFLGKEAEGLLVEKDGAYHIPGSEISAHRYPTNELMWSGDAVLP